MAWDNIPRTSSFALSDFHDFDDCIFRFFVGHNLGKKYEMSKGSANQTLGSLLDLAIKKFHSSKAYNQPGEYLKSLIKAAEIEMRQNVAKNGPNSFYGSQVQFLNSDLLKEAEKIFENYYSTLQGQVKRAISHNTFWQHVINRGKVIKIWGGPDSIELDKAEMPEVVDYKYFSNEEFGKQNLDMDLMPKLYTMLCAPELLKNGYQRARFVIRLWREPKNQSLSREFFLEDLREVEDELYSKALEILSTNKLKFCEKSYCPACNSDNRAIWLQELQNAGWIKS